MPQRPDSHIPEYGSRLQPSSQQEATPVAPVDAAVEQVASLVRSGLPGSPRNFFSQLWQDMRWLLGGVAVLVLVLGFWAFVSQRSHPNASVTIPIASANAPTPTKPVQATASVSPPQKKSTPVSSRRPLVTGVQFPNSIQGGGKSVGGVVRFFDPEGDITWAYFSPLQGYFTPFDFNPDISGKTQGQFGFNLWCATPEQITLQIVLRDRAGNRSVAYPFSFNCVQPRSTPSIPSTNANRGRILSFSAERNTYRVGESIRFNLQLGISSYVYVLDRDPSGRWTLLFPNSYEPNAGIVAGSHTLPSAGSWVATAPVGQETIVLFASETQIEPAILQLILLWLSQATDLSNAVAEALRTNVGTQGWELYSVTLQIHG